MPGFLLRYDGEWYYRRPRLRRWWEVGRDLEEGGDLSDGGLTRVADMEDTLEGLFQAIQEGTLPPRLRPGLLLELPVDRQAVADAIARRPRSTRLPRGARQ